VSVNQDYEVDVEGDGLADVTLDGPAIVVGVDYNNTGIPDLWEGMVLNGIARLVP
jgi:hypothetical protein